MIASLRPRLLVLVLAAAACDASGEGVPEGKLARVGAVVFGPEDVAAVGAQLGAYAQLRFGGAEGQFALLQALVDAEVLAQEAIRQGLGDDPRVHHALLEEVAAVYLSAELERRVPYAEVAADVPRLRAHYDAHLAQFTVPEQRSARGVVFTRWAEAEAALAALQLGTTTLEELGEVVTTPLQARDDAEYFGFHPLLFADTATESSLLPRPLLLGERLLVGVVHEIVPARAEPFDDPAVRERLVGAVRAPLVEAARAELMAELAARHPEVSSR